jgi:hypothetical protein
MKPLLLLIITIVFASNVYAEPEELDRDKYVYYCYQGRLDVDRKGNTRCKNLKKGDVLASIYVKSALLYCDTEHPIMSGIDRGTGRTTYYCFYNGKPIKKERQL